MEFTLFRTLYFFLFFGLSSIVGMLIPFLQYKGYGPIQVSILISLFTISGIFGQLTVGYLCDKFNTIRKIFLPSIIIITITTTTSIIFNNKIIFYTSFFIMGFFYYIMTNVSDSWIMESEEHIKKKFGPLRSFGSIGWATGMLISGFVISNLGYYTINIIYILSLSIAFIVALKIKDTPKKCTDKIDFKLLLKNKEYLLTIGVFLVICTSFRAYSQLVPYKIESVGGNTSNLGIFNFISCMGEVVMLIVCSKIMHKLSPDKLLIVSPIAIMIQGIILLLANNIITMYLSALLQIFTYPVILMVARIMIDRTAPDNLKTSAQLIGFAAFNSIGTIIGSMFIGFFIKILSVNKASIILIVITAIAILSTILYDRKIKDKTL